jgi:WD40 repeat protein
MSEQKVQYVKCRQSASLIPNNFFSNDNQVGYLHSNEVHIISNESSTFLADRAASIVSAYHEKGSITQTRFCKFEFGDALVIVNQSGLVQVYDELGTRLQTSYKFSNKSPKDLTLRGIASDGDQKLWVGTGSGKILMLEVSKSTSTMKLLQTLSEHSEPVTDLTFANNTLVSGDEHGDIIFWSSKGKCMKKLDSTGAHPVTSLCSGHGYAVAGFSTGHIRMYNLDDNILQCEVATHTRCVTAVCMHPTEPVVGSCSEDTFVSVWSLPTDSRSGVQSLLHISPSPFLITGVQFVANGDYIACTAYDSRYISLMHLAAAFDGMGV